MPREFCTKRARCRAPECARARRGQCSRIRSPARTMTAIRWRVGHAHQRFEERALSPGKYSLGRESCDIVFNDENVSARHAELHVLGRGDPVTGLLITDLGSRNATFDPKGQRLTAAYALMPNQPIRLGASSLTWLPPPAAPAPQASASSALARSEKRKRALGLALFWIG